MHFAHITYRCQRTVVNPTILGTQLQTNKIEAIDKEKLFNAVEIFTEILVEGETSI